MLIRHVIMKLQEELLSLVASGQLCCDVCFGESESESKGGSAILDAKHTETCLFATGE